MSDTRHVLKVERFVSQAEVAQLQAAWMSIADVVSVEPDVIAQITAVPNDPEYPSQWHYFSPSTPVGGITYYGVDAIGAWNQGATGNGAVVAVLDTGITPHPDLGLSQVSGMVTGNKLVGQYDFVNDATMGGDGNGRDTNARDEGDYYNGSSSSWHGTHVAGTIAAVTNNGMGVAGIAGDARLLIGRVLGRGGGYGSDISDAIKWAARVPVTGVPLAPVKANVVNLSLGGGSATCPSYYADAITAATNAGTMVVVAAGNSNMPAEQFTPANCVGAVTVAAVGPTGKRSYYSNYGGVVDIAAPGGDAVVGGNLSSGRIRSTWFLSLIHI
jgi:serine protease